MAKAKAAATKEPAQKKVREKKAPKDSYLKDNYVVINEFNGIRTSVMAIRGVGSIVREEVLDNGIVISVSSVFVPSVKVKTKKDWKYLIIDKGPKSRTKASEEEEEEEDED